MQAGQQLQSKKVQPTWTFVLGELAIDIKPARLNAKAPLSQVDICVLGERSFLVLSESGQPRFEKRLDFLPTAMFPYFFDHALNRQNVLLASSTGAIAVVDVNKPGVVWSAKGAVLAPVQLAVGKFGDLPGLVVAMDDAGSLAVTYMGTTAQTKIVQVPENEFDYESLETEHRALLAKIRDATSAKGGRGEAVPDRMVARVQVPQMLDHVRGADIDDMNAGAARTAASRAARTLTAMVFLSYAGKGEATDLHVTVDCPAPVICRSPRTALPSLYGGSRTPCVVSIVLECAADCPPIASTIHVTVAYTTEGGQQRVSSTEFSVPMCLVCKPIQPVKDAQFKITIDTNKPPPRLSALFEDVLGGDGGGDLDSLGGGGAGNLAANVLSFGYPDGSHCTIVVSKNAGRYRIQSNSFLGLGYLTEELCRRLQAYYNAAGAAAAAGPPPGRAEGAASTSSGTASSGGSLKVTLVDPVPLGDLFEVIDRHFALRKRIRELDTDLEKAAALYRAVEKRLLMRFKDKNPQPLSKLEDLLRAAHRDLGRLGDEMTQVQLNLMKEDASLSGALETTVLLAKFSYALSDKAVEMLRGYLSPSVHDAEGAEPGWAEVAEASTTQLLKTTLSKDGAASGAAAVVQVQEFVGDTEKLKKNLTNIFDRLSKGAQLA